jgi:hypothetical protein
MFNVIRLRLMAPFVSDAIKNTTSINREVSALKAIPSLYSKIVFKIG